MMAACTSLFGMAGLPQLIAFLVSLVNLTTPCTLGLSDLLEITSMVISLDVLSLSKVPIGIFGIYRTIGDWT
ncbi:hypothetical protein Nos7524_0792 [Nostoc sp. PCC 7524]|nr:hypothetical protein Nos7524_0792 [Nostoc sp. PCC 7524]